MSGTPPFPSFIQVGGWQGVSGTAGTPSYSETDLFFTNLSGMIESYENVTGWALGFGAECDFSLKCQDFVTFSVNDQVLDLFSVSLSYSSQKVFASFRGEAQEEFSFSFLELELIDFEYRKVPTGAEILVYQNSVLVHTFSTLNYSFPANPNYYKILGGNGDCGCYGFVDHQDIAPINVDFVPSDIGVEVGTTSVELTAVITGGVVPYVVSWLRNGTVLLSNDNPYDFPVTVADIGEFVLGRVVDDEGSVVEYQLNIVESGLRFVVPPSDYSGAVGSTMPVRAELQGGEQSGCPIGESFQASGAIDNGTPFALGDLVESDLVTPFTPFSVTGEGYIANAVVDVSICRFKPVSYDSSAPYEVSVDFVINSQVDTFAFTDFFFDNMQNLSGVDLVMDGATKAFFKLVNPSAIIRQTPSHEEWYGSDITVSAKHTYYGSDVRRIEYFFSGGGVTESLFVEYTQSLAPSYPFNISYWIGRSIVIKSVFIVGQGLPNQCTGITESYNVDLFDNLGVSRDTQVVTKAESSGCPIGETWDSAYAVRVPSASQFRLPATAGGENIEELRLSVTIDEGRPHIQTNPFGGDGRWYLGVYTSPYTKLFFDSVFPRVYIDGVSSWIGETVEIIYRVSDDSFVLKSSNLPLGELQLPVGSSTGFDFISVDCGSSEEATVNSCYIVGQGLPNQCTGVVEGKALYSYDAENMQFADTGEWKLVANGTVESPFNVLITELSWVQTPVSPNIVDLGDNLTITAEVNFSSVDWLLTRDGAPIDNRIGGSSSYSFTRVSELIDNSENWMLYATVGSESISYHFTVEVITEPIKERGEYRYLVELSEKIDWEPTLSTSANIDGNNENRLISVITLGEPVTPNYWTDWGGGYDNPEEGQIELFFNQFLVRVDSVEALLESNMAYTIVDNQCFFTTDIFPWQYFRKLSSVRSSYGFSTTVRDPLNPSNDEYDGIRYPVLLDIPKVTNVEVPDPINGVILSGTFSVTLNNEDKYFDSIAGVNLFNSPVTLKKTDVILPSLSDFDIIRTGLIEDQSVDFNDYRISSADVFRTLTEPACRTITKRLFPSAGKSVGKKMPLAWGYIEKASLISVNSDGTQFIVCDPEYLSSVVDVFDNDGNIIESTVSDGVITSTEEAKTCTFYGLSSNKIGEIIVSEVSQKANIPFVDGVWDVEEVNRYISTSSTVGLLYDGDTVKKLVEECTKSDSAFFMTKNNGLVTIRRWADQYDSHTIESWLITRDPEKEYSEQKYFASSISVGYNHDYESGESSQFFVLDQYESDVADVYSKTQRLTFDTKIDNEVQAGSLAQRLFKRLSRRSEIVRLYTGGNTAKINIADTVLAPIDVNGRSISEFQTWLVRAVDPAQDILVLEQKFGEVQGVSGILSEPTSETESGLMSHITDQNESGELSQPFAIIEG